MIKLGFLLLVSGVLVAWAALGRTLRPPYDRHTSPLFEFVRTFRGQGMTREGRIVTEWLELALSLMLLGFAVLCLAYIVGS